MRDRSAPGKIRYSQPPSSSQQQQQHQQDGLAQRGGVGVGVAGFPPQRTHTPLGRREHAPSAPQHPHGIEGMQAPGHPLAQSHHGRVPYTYAHAHVFQGQRGVEEQRMREEQHAQVQQRLRDESRGGRDDAREHERERGRERGQEQERRLRDDQPSREEMTRRERERDPRLFRDDVFRARERERGAPPPSGGLGQGQQGGHGQGLDGMMDWTRR